MFTEKHKGIFHVSNHSPEKGADMLEKEILNIWYLNIYHNVLVHPAWAMIGCFEKLVLEKWTIDQLYISQVGQCQFCLCRIKWFTLYKTKIIQWCWAILSTSLPRNALKPWKTHLWSVGFCCPFMGFPTMSRIDLGIKKAQIQRDRSNVAEDIPGAWSMYGLMGNFQSLKKNRPQHLRTFNTMMWLEEGLFRVSPGFLFLKKRLPSRASTRKLISNGFTKKFIWESQKTKTKKDSGDIIVPKIGRASFPTERY